MLWLGERRGYLTDWVTQRWVQLTGRRVDVAADERWLAGAVGSAHEIGREFFARLAEREKLELRRAMDAGLLADLRELAGPAFDPARVHPDVAAFYTNTAAYDLDAWGEWCGLFRPFGRLLALLFSRRLQQLNVPLSALDTSRGITSEVFQLVEPRSGEVRYTVWFRTLVATGRVLYAGSYSVVRVPGYAGPCVKVVFPLPNGNAQVLMRPTAHADGSLTVTSAGQRFGDPGFYFSVHHRPGASPMVWARYVRALRESIHVYAAPDGVRADHVLMLFGATFLRLHYRLLRRADGERRAGDALQSSVVA
jgi:hypothetical protein